MDLRDLQMIGEGADHDVFLHPADARRVLKVPKKKLVGTRNFNETRENLRLVKEHFGRWLAETEIEKNRFHGYVLHQERIDGIHIRPASLKACGDAFAALLDAHNDSNTKSGHGVDFFGLEGGWKTVLSHIQQIRGSAWDTFLISPMSRAAAAAGRTFPLFHSFRTAPRVWSQPDPIDPEISNVLHQHVTDDVKIVDVDILRAHGSKTDRLRAWVINAFQDYYLTKFFAGRQNEAKNCTVA